MTSRERTRGDAETSGPRLQALLELLPQARVLADVGCDHAELACAAVASGRVGRAIGIDRSASALASGARTVARWGLEAQVELRLGDGFAPLATSDGVDAAALAGIGGRTVLAVCARRDPRSVGVRWLLVQPNRDVAAVRHGLSAAGWGVVDERLPEVGGRGFPSILFDARAEPLALTALQAWLGPHLLRDRPPGLARLAGRIRAHLGRRPPGTVEVALLDALEREAARRPGSS